MLRPWLAALALAACALTSLVVFAWTVDFRAPDVVSGLGEVSANARLPGIAMSLRREAVDLRRSEVRRLRQQRSQSSEHGRAVAAELSAARHALADELRDVALMADAASDLDLAREWMTEAVHVAPERAELLCLLTELRTRDADPDQRRMEFLRLVHDDGSACAHLLAAQSFLDGGDAEAARTYLERAVQRAPQWAEPRLLMARMQLRANDHEAARGTAAEALALAPDLASELRAAALLRSAGGVAPPRWRIIARWAWGSYAYALPSLAIFVILLLSPAIVRLVKRGIEAVRSQRKTAESAS